MHMELTELLQTQVNLHESYLKTRRQSDRLCEPLQIEDYVAQPITDVSPPKWHLAHTTWFFEHFVLVPNMEGYKVFHNDFCFLFNSYYVSVGARWLRSDRGNLTRPGVEEIYAYRRHVDEAMNRFLGEERNAETFHLLELGIQHEQQHQELLLYDIKFILGQNPLFPKYREGKKTTSSKAHETWLTVDEGLYNIGYNGPLFHFDNEEGEHKVYLHRCAISDRLITNGDFLAFMEDGGYRKTTLWLAEGWDWKTREQIESPLYWIKKENGWHYYTLFGLQPLDLNEPVAHVSFYESDAFARWKGLRLPTEFEWEMACKTHPHTAGKQGNLAESGYYCPLSSSSDRFLGNLWQWTSSSYAPYPYYNPPAGAIGEYNGKFMANQMVLRGGSFATPADHIRPTYRNFFHPHLQWLFCGFRLAKHI